MEVELKKGGLISFFVIEGFSVPGDFEVKARVIDRNLNVSDLRLANKTFRVQIERYILGYQNVKFYIFDAEGKLIDFVDESFPEVRMLFDKSVAGSIVFHTTSNAAGEIKLFDIKQVVNRSDADPSFAPKIVLIVWGEIREI